MFVCFNYPLGLLFFFFFFPRGVGLGCIRASASLLPVVSFVVIVLAFFFWIIHRY
jgi:hypothetical protein